ncbi:hypothetical protein GPECTOR_106g122 [Gonium pectorale]|uniref:Uncharacterized protein n=1 Tax=Gonium pectorale TaxID=33097 RepID=A0A150FZM4_GONPE|nr:hypothetical protein GPECTOR_106g122 [Gonium pectorale]|eukprot:KXZ43028.1 hypothetical protein GPECTOR_106g122 [Gonium pectorale]
MARGRADASAAGTCDIPATWLNVFSLGAYNLNNLHNAGIFNEDKSAKWIWPHYGALDPSKVPWYRNFTMASCFESPAADTVTIAVHVDDDAWVWVNDVYVGHINNIAANRTGLNFTANVDQGTNKILVIAYNNAQWDLS